MHGNGASERRGARLAEAEIADLALLDELGHCSDRLLDRHLRINAVHVVEINDVHVQALKALVDRDASGLGSAVPLAIGIAAPRSELRRDLDFVSAAGD